MNIEYDNVTSRRATEQSTSHWPIERYDHVIRLKEQALNYAREIWADYIFVNFLDILIIYFLISLKKILFDLMC